MSNAALKDLLAHDVGADGALQRSQDVALADLVDPLPLVVFVVVVGVRDALGGHLASTTAEDLYQALLGALVGLAIRAAK